LRQGDSAGDGCEQGLVLMWRAFKFLFRIAILAFLGLVAYAMLTDLPPPTHEIVQELPMPAAK